MALIVEFICELPNGVHARPASHVETLCNTFSSQIEWHNLRTDRKGNAKSALALIGTDTLVGDNCQLLISGADEQEAHQRLSQWLRDEFPHCDAPLAEVKSDELEPLPVSLTNLNPQIIRARTVCSGSAGGILTPISSLDLNALSNLPAAKGVDAEQSALENGLTKNVVQLAFTRCTGAIHIEHFSAEQTNAFRTIAECGLRFHGVSDVSGNFNADTVCGTRLLGQPDTLLLTQSVLYAGFLLIITGHGFPWLNHNRPCVAVDINRLMLPRSKGSNIHTYQRRNVERTGKNYGM
mgnify:CR=1 FL=1